jgi:hypothetical protein
MNLAKYAPLIAGILFIAMALLMDAGRRIGSRTTRGSEKPPQFGAIDGAVFALLGLLIAFTFSGATTRFDQRRHWIVEEANHVGTAWLRIDLLPADAQPGMRNLFREYLDSRLEIYRKPADRDAARKELERSNALQRRIWDHAVSGCDKAGSHSCAVLLLPALNQMIDITTTRTMATQFHPPMIIFGMLIAFALTASVLAGYTMSGGPRSWLHIAGFSFALALTVYVIIDIEYPRAGFIRVDAADQVLRDLRSSME